EKQIIKRQDLLTEEKESGINERQELALKQDRLIESEKRLQEAHDDVIRKLGTIKMKWAGITDLYMREHTIEDELKDLHQKLSREQETLLQQERIARRLLDDYEEADMFFGDMFLMKQLDSLRNQLDYVVSGVEFHESLDEVQRKKYEGYRLWPMTDITTKESKQLLLD